MKTIKDIIEEMLEYRRGINMSSYTESRIIPMLRLFLEFIETSYSVTMPGELRSDHLRGYQKHIAKLVNYKGMPLKPGSLNNRVKAVRSLLVYMKKCGYIVYDMKDHILYVKEPSLLPTSVLTHAQVKKFMSSVDTSNHEGCRNRAMLEVLYSSGIRCSELTSLTVDNVDLDSRLMKVMGKGSKERVVPIGKTAVKHLSSYIRGIRPFMSGHDEYREIFLTINGTPVKPYVVRQVVKKYVAKSNLETHVSPHTFRRSCTTEMIRGNANIYHVKELLGHESLETLKPYTKLTIMDLRKTHAKCHPREKDN